MGEAELAYELQAAKTKQRIKEENMQIKVIERTQEIAIQSQEIQRRERELDSSVRRPAEAEAEAVALKGDAEAYAIEIKAKAEAEKMAKKADAWKEYKEAAMVDMMLQTLPKVAAEVAAPLSQAKKITMVSDVSGEVGAARITNEVLDIMVKVPDMVNKMTGVDITNNLAGNRSMTGSSMASPALSNRLRIR